jgi:Uma2 family endonuclease
MLAEPKTIITPEAFAEFLDREENMDRRFELLDGEIFEVTSNWTSSEIAALILGVLSEFARRNKLGWVTGADGGYIVSGQKIVPDAAFISAARQPERSHETQNPLAPDLVVEVVSPSDKQRTIRRKLAAYADAGTLVWLVYPLSGRIEVYPPDDMMTIKGADDSLEGGAVLPGFTRELTEIFRA